MAASKRLAKELKDAQASDDAEIQLQPVDGNVYEWRAVLRSEPLPAEESAPARENAHWTPSLIVGGSLVPGLTSRRGPASSWRAAFGRPCR